MSSITTINSGDLISGSRTDINTNFSNLNTDKIETSYLDTDTTLAANSDSKIATQKAVKAYVDAGGNSLASTTVKGIVEEATQAEVDAGTATGATGARLFVNPSTISITNYLQTTTATAGQTFTGATLPTAAWIADGTGTETTLTSATSGTTNILTGFGYSVPTGQGEKVAKKTVIGANGVVLTKIIARLSGTGGGSSVQVTATVQGDTGSQPDGIPIGTSDTIAVSGASADKTFTFSSAVELLPSTTYWLVLTGTSPVGTGGEVQGNTTGGGSTFGIYDGSSWSTDANKNFNISATMTYIAGYIYKTDTALTEPKQFDGFVVNNVSKDATTLKLVSGYGGLIISGFTGLTIGGLYYCDGIGTISLTTTSGLIVGRAISATTIFCSKTIN